MPANNSNIMPPARNFPPLAFGRVANESQGGQPGHYINVGQVLVRWAKNRAEWPSDVGDFENQLHVTRVEGQGNDRWMFIPAVYTKITITQAGDGSDASPNLVSTNPVNTGALVSPQDSHTVTLQGSVANGTEFVLRLPPASQVAESEDHVAAGFRYLLPPVYEGFSSEMLMATNNDDLPRFYARVADYTMRGCR